PDNADLTKTVSIPAASVRYYPGDFNGDGAVNAADYVFWRTASGARQTDYNTWRSYFGVTSTGGSDTPADVSSVPEPAVFLLAAWCLAVLFAARPRIGAPHFPDAAVCGN